MKTNTCERTFSPDADDCVNCKERVCRDKPKQTAEHYVLLHGTCNGQPIMSCARCKQETAQGIKADLEKELLETCEIKNCLYANLCMTDLAMSKDCKRWQQFWKRFGVK